MKNIQKILIIAIILRTVVAALYPLTGDSFLHVSASKYIADTGMYPSEDIILYGSEISFFYPPLLHYLMAILIQVLDLNYLNYMVLKILPMIAGVLSIYFAYRLLIELGTDKRDAELAALVLTFIPVHVFYSSVLYIDIFPALFVPMTVFYLIKGIKDRKFMYLFLIFCSIASWSYMLGLVAPIFAVAYILMNRDQLRKTVPFLLAAVLLSSPFYILMSLRTGQLIWTGGTGGVEISDQRSLISSFYSFWIGAPNSGPGYERMMSYLPALRIPMILWSLIFSLITIIALFKISRIPRELQILLLVSLPGLIVFPEFSSKILSAAPAIALIFYLALKSIPIRKKYVMVIFCLMLLHVVPFAYMLNQKWMPYHKIYSYVRSECEFILTGDVGRISVNTDRQATAFGRLGINSSNIESGYYQTAVDEASEAGVDCIFYDSYTIENLLDEKQVGYTLSFLDYLSCPIIDDNGISFYFCKI